MKPFNTPVLFLIYNRPDLTQEVFSSIRLASPPRLYIACDGAKNEQEAAIVNGIRESILGQIDWSCEVKTLFRANNLGCKKAVSEAVTWFFENEEMGIILEDDCLPSQNFFILCEELLAKYQDDMRVWHIAGNNFLEGYIRDPDYSYYYSYYGSIWGWATWRNRWQKYDVTMGNLPEIVRKEYMWDVFGNWSESNFRLSKFKELQHGLNTWDYQWAFARLINSGLSIVPHANLVTNIGFGPHATHTKDDRSRMSQLSLQEPVFPIKSPPMVIRDKISDDYFFNSLIKKRSWWDRILRKIFKK